MAINIPILSSLNADGFEKAAREFKALKTNGEKANFAISKAALPAAAALAAVGAAAVTFVKAAMEDNTAALKLSTTIKNVTGSSNEAIAANEKYITSLMLSTNTADDFLRPAQARLIRSTEDITEAQALLALAVDISVGSGKDLESVTSALAKGYDGNLTSLGKLGLGIDQSQIKAKDFGGIIKTLGDKFKGFGETAAQTAEGKLKTFSLTIAEMKESIGNLLLPVVIAILKPLQNLANWASEHTTTFVIVVGVITGLAAAIVAVNIAMKIWTATTKAFAAVQLLFNAAMAANPIGLIVVAVGLFIAALVIAYKKFEGFRNIVNSGLNIMIDGFEGWANIFISAVNLITKGINSFTGLFKYVGIEIGKIGPIAAVEFGRVGDSVEMTRGHLLRLDDNVKVVKETAIGLVPTLNDVSTGLGKVGGASKKTEDQTKKTAAAFAKMRAETVKLRAAEKARAEALANTYENALSNAKEFLANARKDFSDFASGVSGAITGAFSFGEALEAGKKAGGGFLDGLRIEATKAQTFGARISSLIDAGLSGPALDQIIKAGAEAGTVIADELLGAAGTGAIAQANQLTADVQAVADKVGALAAGRFKQAGIDNAQAYIDGVQATIDRYKLAASIVGTDANTAGRFAADIAGLASIYGGLTAMASGGIVTSPTMALIGESGPEAVIPLGSGGGLGNTYNISVDAGIAGNPVEIGQQIVTAISKYERSAGTNWRS